MSAFAARRALRVAPALIIATLAACADENVAPPAVETISAIQAQRIAVADAGTATLRVLSAEDGTTIQNFSLGGGPASLVYTSGSSGRFVTVQQRTQNLVEVFDIGSWADGNVAYLQAPTKLSFSLNEALPTHENVNGHWKSIFFDGTGFARWIDERSKLAGNPQVAFSVNTGGPHHSGSSTLEVNGQPAFIYAPLNPAGGLPTSIVAVNASGTEIARVDNCPSMHGNGTVATAALWGCQDGAVLVRHNGTAYTATKLTPTGDLAGLGVRTVWGRGNLPWLVGRLSAPPGQPTQRVLATVNATTGEMNRLPTPTGVNDHWVAVEPHDGLVVVLGVNGTLYVYNGTTRTLVHTVPSIVPALPASGAITHQVAVVEGMAAVASPYTNEVVLVDLTTGTVRRRLSVTGQPSRLAILGPSAAGTYQRAR
jgi:hypothetical protein